MDVHVNVTTVCISLQHGEIIEKAFVLTFLSTVICCASALSWLMVSCSLSRSFCRVCLHSLSIFKSVSSCNLQKTGTFQMKQLITICKIFKTTTYICFSLWAICFWRLSALLAKSCLNRRTPSSVLSRSLSASCNLV